MIATSETEQKFVNLKCPECGAPVIFVREEPERQLVSVSFKCMFSAMLNSYAPEEAQRILDEFKSSGRMQKWLEGGMF
jgi:hypothetical protein